METALLGQPVAVGDNDLILFTMRGPGDYPSFSNSTFPRYTLAYDDALEGLMNHFECDSSNSIGTDIQSGQKPLTTTRKHSILLRA